GARIVAPDLGRPPANGPRRCAARDRGLALVQVVAVDLQQPRRHMGDDFLSLFQPSGHGANGTAGRSNPPIAERGTKSVGLRRSTLLNIGSPNRTNLGTGPNA